MKFYITSQNIQYLHNIGVPNETADAMLEYLFSVNTEDRKGLIRKLRQNPTLTVDQLQNAPTGKASHLEKQNVPKAVIDYANDINPKYAVWISKQITDWLKLIKKIGEKVESAKQNSDPAVLENVWVEMSKVDSFSQSSYTTLYKYFQYLKSGRSDIKTIIGEMANREHWNYIFDWAEETNPDLMSMDLPSAGQASLLWHRELAQKQLDESSKYKTHNSVFKLSNGWEIVKLAPSDCETEGNKMGHCVGGYADRISRGDTEIYSLRDNKDNPHVTIEMKLPASKEKTKISVDQIQGKKNEEPIAEYKELIKQWFSSLKNQGYTFNPVWGEETIDVTNFGKYMDEADEYGLPYDMSNIGGNPSQYESNFKEAYESGSGTVRNRGYNESIAMEAIDNLILYALSKGNDEEESFVEGASSFGEWASDEFYKTVDISYLPQYPTEPMKEDFVETYQEQEDQPELQNAGFDKTKNEFFNQQAYQQAYNEYESLEKEYDRNMRELSNEFPPTKIANYIFEEFEKKRKEKNRREMAAKSKKTIKTSDKKVPKGEELASYVEALNIHKENGRIKDPVMIKLIENLPYPDRIRNHFSEQECRLVFESISFAWKKLTGQDLVEEAKILHAPTGLEGNYWMLTGGIILEGVNHFTIIKQNFNLFCTLLNISAFVMHEKMSSPPDELIKTIIDHGGMRVFINKDKNSFFQLSDDTYSKWGRKKIKKLDLPNKTVKVIDRTTPYKGWESGILVKL